MLASSASLTWLATKAGMMPHGLRPAWANCATVSLRPARSGPKAPSPLVPWQFLHWVAGPSQIALPAATSPWACAAKEPSGRVRSAAKSRFIGKVLPDQRLLSAHPWSGASLHHLYICESGTKRHVVKGAPATRGIPVASRTPFGRYFTTRERAGDTAAARGNQRG